jgi:hypothetical protein
MAPKLARSRDLRQYKDLELVEFKYDEVNKIWNVTNRIPLEPEDAVTPDGDIVEIEAYTYTSEGEVSRYFRLDVQKVSLVATTLEAGSSGWKFLSVPIKRVYYAIVTM